MDVSIHPANRSRLMIFAAPFWLLMLPVLAWTAWKRRSERRPGIVWAQPLSGEGYNTWRARLRRRLPLFRWATLLLLVLALARPQERWKEQKIITESVDLILAMDISLSMLTRDFPPDRLTVAKKVAIDFVENRPDDRLGLTAFAGEAFTQCPLTTNRKAVQDFIQQLQVGYLDQGTAIGMGLATAVNRLKESSAKSRVVILLTDGENTIQEGISPEKAVEVAKALGIKVYTIGIGTQGMVLSPTGSPNPDGSYNFSYREFYFNTALLELMADQTGGKFYRAYSERDLGDIYREIDRLEKTPIETITLAKSRDYFHYLLWAALAILALEFLLARFFLRGLT